MWFRWNEWTLASRELKRLNEAEMLSTECLTQHHHGSMGNGHSLIKNNYNIPTLTQNAMPPISVGCDAHEALHDDTVDDPFLPRGIIISAKRSAEAALSMAAEEYTILFDVQFKLVWPTINMIEILKMSTSRAFIKLRIEEWRNKGKGGSGRTTDYTETDDDMERGDEYDYVANNKQQTDYGFLELKGK